MKDLIEVTKEEKIAIYKLTEYLSYKWSHKTANRANLQEFAYEASSRYAELGYIVNVDITPALVGVGRPDISIVGKIHNLETDHDRIRYDVKKEYKEKGKL
jgi:hypothetical protein